MSGLLPESSLVSSGSPLDLEQEVHHISGSSVNILLHGRKHTYKQFNSLYPHKKKHCVFSLCSSIQSYLHLGILVVTEADTALSRRVGGQAERRNSKQLRI